MSQAPQVESTNSAITAERMQCMEVWGGNQQTNTHFFMPGLEMWIFSQPYHNAQRGGDVYYTSACASGRITRMLLADVSGHGNSAATVGTELRDLMRRNINVIKQTRFVQQMNTEFTQATADDRFATAVVCSFFAPTQTLELCNAGHPVPLVFRAATESWSTIEQQETDRKTMSDMPLGIVEDSDYSQVKLKLQRNDMVLCFSDAVTEAANPDGTLLGSEGVLRILKSLGNFPTTQLISELTGQIQKLNSNNLTDDDLTLILMRATETRTTLLDNLKAPFRLFRRVNDRTKFEFKEH